MHNHLVVEIKPRHDGRPVVRNDGQAVIKPNRRTHLGMSDNINRIVRHRHAENLGADLLIGEASTKAGIERTHILVDAD